MWLVLIRGVGACWLRGLNGCWAWHWFRLLMFFAVAALPIRPVECIQDSCEDVGVGGPLCMDTDLMASYSGVSSCVGKQGDGVAVGEASCAVAKPAQACPDLECVIGQRALQGGVFQCL